ncbi:sensor histidine kinase [Mammaliicoccus vitulinus]|uniref:sensor histidine kinase n=1 Tax=Mammaliicoccus vitulinus TaxID=71237 RepID=UPI00145AA88C|nr:HAMP domain-containing sensor histidine kinase [Mammaliicoccus vitulinus]QJF24869.1 HAMP domain-containing histidine kinase [Mammaliicoccus vitulinus]
MKFKSLAQRITIYTIVVMTVSSILGFVLTNIYYHIDLKEKNDYKVMETLKKVQKYIDHDHEMNLDTYLEHLSELHYQAIIYDDKMESTYYGDHFRKYNLDEKSVKKVLNGKTYHGIKERPFNIFITGFFDNETRNTVGMKINHQGSEYALFLRPSVGSMLGEFRIFLAILLVLLVVISLVLVMFSSHSLANPIRRLMNTTESLGKGDFDVDIKVTRDDEIGILQHRFIKMRDELKQLETMRQSFVQNVSHEIKSPLQSILSLLRELEYEKNESKRVQIIEDIYGRAYRLSNLTKQLLLLSELDNSDHLTFNESIELDKVIKEVVRNLNYLLDDKEISIVFDMEAITIQGNNKLLYQAFYNILNNAIKYSPEYSMIQINVSKQDGFINVSFIDEGYGMTQKQLSQIRDRFYKGDQSHNVHVDSNGLGLSIVDSIIEHHNAQIFFESVLDEGTKVTILFEHDE